MLHARDPRRGECVAVCSTAALRRGVRVDMPLSEAIALLELRIADCGLRNEKVGERRATEKEKTRKEPNVSSTQSAILAPHQPDADREALLQLAAWCEQFSPHVGLEVHLEPQSLLMDVTGLGPLFGGEESLAWRVIEAFGRRGYSIRVAVADTVGAAWALSRFGADPRGSYSPLNKGEVRPRMEPTPDVAQSIMGLTPRACQVDRPVLVSAPRIVPPGEHVAALAPLAIEALRLPQPTRTALHQLGLFQIGQVAELPRASLASRFQHQGQCVLLERLDQASGVREELITPHRPPPEFRAERCFEYPLQRLAEVRFVLAELFQQVCRELAARDQGAVRAVCRLDCEGGEMRKLDIGLFQPTAAAERLLELATLQLDRMRLPGAAGRIGVEVPLAAPLGVRQQALFLEEGRTRPRELALLIDRLSSRLGHDRVLRPRLLPDAQPERSFCEESLVGEREMRHAECGSRDKKRLRPPSSLSLHQPFPFTSRTSHSAFERPLRLWSSPIAIEVVAVADGPPASFRVGRRRFRVHRWWGPERIETGWWRGQSIRRDYYQVETTTGARYWLFRQLRTRRWFLHGEHQ